MADLNERQQTDRRITDTKTGTDHTAPVSGQSLTVNATGRYLLTEQGDIATWDGSVRPANAPELAFCRTCNHGPFSSDAVTRCSCGTISCKRCATHHNGVWLCRRCNWKRRAKALLALVFGS